jgi:site-specific DNA recombinase
LHNADKEFGITLTSIISLASRAYEIFESSKIEQKRQLINFMFSNLRMNGEKLRFNLRKPFNLMIDLTNRPDWLLIIDIIRTKYHKELRLLYLQSKEAISFK